MNNVYLDRAIEFKSQSVTFVNFNSRALQRDEENDKKMVAEYKEVKRVSKCHRKICLLLIFFPSLYSFMRMYVPKYVFKQI